MVPKELRITLLKALWSDLKQFEETGELDEHFEVSEEQLDALRYAINLLELGAWI